MQPVFNLAETSLPGVRLFSLILRKDERGQFVKTFHADFFSQHGMRADFKEQYVSVSKKGVLRGLHFQLPPHDHAKLVTCLEGEVLDVVVDLRKASPTFGKHAMFTLRGSEASQLYIPSGMAHGFYVTSDEATLLYNVTSAYAPEHDTGILWNSAGINWPDKSPILSGRDKEFAPFSDLKSPF